jgi:uncharacterized protein (DUF433 family)
LTVEAVRREDELLPYGPSQEIWSSMSALHDVESLLPTLSRAEKLRLLQTVVRDLGDDFPGIESRSGVCGGEPCIVWTRIPVWLLEQARRLGSTDAELLQAYPTLRAEDLSQAWAYVRVHGDAIERQIRENEEA